MTAPFFITGLPRSRTAWLANWFTTGPTFCYHDRRFEMFLVERNGARRTGFSGPEIVTQAGTIQDLYPDAPWIVVLRNSEKAFASFLDVMRRTKIGLPLDQVEAVWNQRKNEVIHLCARPNVLPVDFSDLDQETVARRVWAHVLPGVAFDLERWKLLKEFNVQQQLEGQRATETIERVRICLGQQ